GAYDLAGAISDYLAALKLNEDASTHSNLGTAYQANNNNPQALAEYNKAIQMDPKLPDPYYFRGTLYEGMNQPALALPDYRKYVVLAPAGPYAADAKNRINILSKGTRAAAK